MNTTEILIAGFGGQGVLFAGKLLAYKGLLENRQLSWLPSYGPEMRGGTANCSIILSDTPVGSPIVSNPDILVAMNLPSFDKYESTVRPGGMIIVDSSLIERKSTRTDVQTFYIPATKMAADSGIPTLANMLILGKLIRESGVVAYEGIEEALKKVVSAKRIELLEVNRRAIELGYQFEG